MILSNWVLRDEAKNLRTRTPDRILRFHTQIAVAPTLPVISDQEVLST